MNEPNQRRSDLEHDQAVKVIKILVKHRLIPIVAQGDAYLRTYLAAFEILDEIKGDI